MFRLPAKPRALQNRAAAALLTLGLAAGGALILPACERTPPPAPPSQAAGGAQVPNPTGATPPAQADETGETEDEDERGANIPGLADGTDAQYVLLVEAKKAFLTEDISRAEALFKTLANTEPTSGPQVSATIALAQIYNESGRSAEALKLYESLSEEVGELPEIQLVIARALAQQGEFERAERTYRALLKIQPDYAFAQLELGQMFADQGRTEDAAQALYQYEQQIYRLSATLEAPETPDIERLRVLNIFSLVSDDRATQATLTALSSRSAPVRAQAAVVLGQTGATEAREALRRMAAEESDIKARMAAQGALKELDAIPSDAAAPEGPVFVGEQADLPQ